MTYGLMIICVHYFYITGRWQRNPCLLTRGKSLRNVEARDCISALRTTLMYKVIKRFSREIF